VSTARKKERMSRTVPAISLRLLVQRFTLGGGADYTSRTDRGTANARGLWDPRGGCCGGVEASRALAVYIVLLLILRLAGSRTLAGITTFDFVLVLIISEAVQQALIDDATR
jgi:hypothetical protein